MNVFKKVLSKLIQLKSCEEIFYDTWKSKGEVSWKHEKFMVLVKIIQNNMWKM